jgi:hypothetical protein
MSAAWSLHRPIHHNPTHSLLDNVCDHPSVQRYCKLHRCLLMVRSVNGRLVLMFGDSLKVFETPQDMIDFANGAL